MTSFEDARPAGHDCSPVVYARMRASALVGPCAPLRYAERMRLAALWSATRWACASAVLAAVAGLAFVAGRASPPASAASARFESRAPAVITAIHDVARLETTQFHVEKVIEASEAQSRLWGLVQAKDALLLVAVGEVVAGVDLSGVREEDVRVDRSTGSITVRLPPPQIVTSRLDGRATHVYARTTDALATRNEELEGEARRSAEEQMRLAAVEAGILDRARASTERTLRALLQSLGYERVDLDWREAS